MRRLLVVLCTLLAVAPIAQAQNILWDTLSPNSELAVLSDSSAGSATEAADDFWVSSAVAPLFEVRKVRVQLLTTSPSPDLTELTLDVYRSYPFDSDTGRTPLAVRTNGPGDDALVSFSKSNGDLGVSLTSLGSFTVANTILGGTAHRFGVRADGFTGTLWNVDIALTNPIVLASSPSASDQATHYWLTVTGASSNSDIYWVAGARPPSVFPGTGDRQAWIKPAIFHPDWRRVSDVINQQDGTLNPAYNLSFRIEGALVPEPGSLLVLGIGIAGVFLRRRR